MSERAIPFGHGMMFVRPFAMEGARESGIFVEHHRLLYKIYGEVTAIHPTCRGVRVGDFVLFMPNRTIKLHRPKRAELYALREEQVLGVVVPADGAPWFQEQESLAPAAIVAA